MFPSLFIAGTLYGIPPTKIIYDVMIAANSDFSTPYGYQTNMMVAGLGAHTFKDFLRFGVPLQILLIPVTTLAIYYVEYWYLVSAAAALIFLLSLVVIFFSPVINKYLSSFTGVISGKRRIEKQLDVGI